MRASALTPEERRFWAYAEALDPWREKLWRCPSNNYKPQDHSADNLLLFWSTHMVRLNALAGRSASAQMLELCHAERENYIRFVRACEIKPGYYHRWPGDDQGPTTFDDLLGLCTTARLLGLPFAREILRYGQWHGWKWGAGEGFFNREYRIPLFPPTVRICAGSTPWPWEESGFDLAFDFNYYEPKAETSGRCLLLLAGWACHRADIHLPRVSAHIEHWWQFMSAKFPGGPQQIYGTYFGLNHPFAVFAPRKFGPVWECV